MPHTINLHRVIAAPPEKIYRAFLEADALAKWLPPDGFTCTVEHLNASVGGTFRCCFRNFTTAKSTYFGGRYLGLEANRSLRYTDCFEDSQLPGEIVVSVRLEAVLCGTELHISQANLPDAIPACQCYLGWQQSLNNLARLVEPHIAC